MNKKRLTILTAIASCAIVTSTTMITIASLDNYTLIEAQEKQTTGFVATWNVNEPNVIKTEASDPRYKQVSCDYFTTKFNSEHMQVGGDNGFLFQNLEKIKITFNSEISIASFTSFMLNQVEIPLQELTIAGNTIETGIVNIKDFNGISIVKVDDSFAMSEITFTYSCQ